MIRSSEKGFSMIEVTIAIFLFGFLFVACMLSYGTSMGTSSANKARNNAIRLAQQAVEELKQFDQMDLTRQSAIWTNENGPLRPFRLEIDGIEYRVTRNLIQNQSLNQNIRNDNNYIPVRITVNWNYRGPCQLVVDTCLIQWVNN